MKQRNCTPCVTTKQEQKHKISLLGLVHLYAVSQPANVDYFFLRFFAFLARTEATDFVICGKYLFFTYFLPDIRF
jgi:hypothetical protein